MTWVQFRQIIALVSFLKLTGVLALGSALLLSVRMLLSWTNNPFTVFGNIVILFLCLTTHLIECGNRHLWQFTTPKMLPMRCYTGENIEERSGSDGRKKGDK